MERILPIVQPAAVGRGRGSGRVVVALAFDDHAHQWRLSDAVGLFSCGSRRCLLCAVCLGCLGSLDVALVLREDIEGLALYWCPAHQGGGACAQ